MSSKVIASSPSSSIPPKKEDQVAPKAAEEYIGSNFDLPRGYGRRY